MENLDRFLSWTNAELDNWEQNLKSDLVTAEQEENDEWVAELEAEQEEINDLREVANNLEYNHSLD